MKPEYPTAPTAAAADIITRPTDINQLRQDMRAAPFYENDADRAKDGLPTHEYGSYPAIGDRSGRVITVVQQPSNKIYGKDGKEEFNFTPTANRFHEVYAFSGWFNRSIGPAMQNLGFSSTEHTTDTKGSKLLEASYPSPEELTKKLQERGIDGLVFESYESTAQSPTPSDEQVITALAEGKILVPSNPKLQASKMVFSVAIWALLPPEYTALLRAKAHHVLDPASPPISRSAGMSGPVVKRFGALSLGVDSNTKPVSTDVVAPSYRAANIREYALDLYRIGILGLAPDLDDAVELGETSYTPTPVEKLGWTLARLVETTQVTLPEGTAVTLAEATVAHVKHLR